MLTAALLLTFFIGFLVMNLISTKFTYCERIGFSFPIGLALITFVMMFRDWMGASITATSSMGIAIILFVCFLALNIILVPRKETLKGLKPNIDFSWFNLIWLVFLILLVWVEYYNFAKCMYYPTYDRDSMAGFDTIGWLAAQEHTYKGLDIFTGDYMPAMHAPASCISYLPMVQLAYAFVYSLGAETSKTIPAFFYLPFIIGFYGMAKRTMNHTAAMVITLGMVYVPEMISFSSLSVTNVMQAAMASTGLIYVCIWCNTKQREHLILGALLIAINQWLRAEGIVFGATAGFIVLLQCIRKKSSWLTLIAPVLTLIPTVAFFVYSSSCGLTSESTVIAHPFWDGAKAQAVWNGAWNLLTIESFYGWSFYFGYLAIIANAYFSIKKKDNLNLLLALCMSMLLYYVILYQVDYKWDSIDNVLSYSAKRFMFCYVPIAWYYFGNCHAVQLGFNWIEGKCGWEK